MNAQNSWLSLKLHPFVHQHSIKENVKFNKWTYFSFDLMWVLLKQVTTC